MTTFYRLTSGRILEVVEDPYAPNPRDPRQTSCKFYSFSRIYNSPDPNPFATFEELCKAYGVEPSSLDEDFEALAEGNPGVLFYPLSVVTVGGVDAYTIGVPDLILETTPEVQGAVLMGVAILSCRPEDTMRFGWKIDLSADDFEATAIEIILAELEDYNLWANNEVYKAFVFDENGNMIPDLTILDALGSDPTTNGICEELGDGVVCQLDEDDLAEMFGNKKDEE